MNMKLLPCPFCGAAARTVPVHSGELQRLHPAFDIECSNDACAVQPSAGSAQAWNTRPAPAAQEAVAWRGINELGEVVTDWIEGTPPSKFVDLCGNEASYASIQLAYSPAVEDAKDAERYRWLREEGRDVSEVMKLMVYIRDAEPNYHGSGIKALRHTHYLDAAVDAAMNEGKVP